MKEMVGQFPGALNRINSRCRGPFSNLRIQKPIDDAFHRQLAESGGYIVIDETEALVAIDVNRGEPKAPATLKRRFCNQSGSGGRNCGNCVCAMWWLITRFIDMKSGRSRWFTVNEGAVETRQGQDNVLPLSALGLMEMTRQRAQESLSDSIYENCPYCQGRGVVKTSMTTSVELHRTLNTVMRKYQESVHDFRVILNPGVLKRLKEEDEEFLVELERRYAGRLMFRGDPAYHHEKFPLRTPIPGRIKP